MISDTPISDSTPHNVAELGMLCRRLERELTAANDRIKRLEEDLMDAKNQYAVLVADVVLYEDRGERIKRLEEELERTKQDRNAIAKKTREPLLLKLDHAAERIKRLEEVGDALANTQTYDLLETVNWRKAKEAKP